MTQHAYRVGVWCAVSSRPQANTDKESLPAQEAAGHDLARAIGGEVVRVYRVPGHSRDYWNWYEAEKEMPAYRQVREDLEAGRLDVIHCLDADRLGRDPALVQQFYSLAERHRCEVYDASMPHTIGQQSIGHRYGTAVKSVAAGEDQRRRVQRHKMGMKGRIRRGLPSALWPHGYEPIRDDKGEVVAGRFTPDIEAVRLLTRWFLRGDSYDTMLRRIRKTPFPAPGGGAWCYRTIHRMMNNDTYAGLVSWGPWKAELPSSKYPAAWDPQTHRAIIRERERRGKQYIHPRGSPLQGAVFCLRCGGPMGLKRQQTSGRIRPVLRCARHAEGKRTGFTCHYNSIPLGHVLAELDEWIAQLATDEAIEKALAQTPSRDTAAEDLAVYERLADDLRQQQHRLALAYAGGAMNLEVYQSANDELADRLDRTEQQILELKQHLASVPTSAERITAARELFAHFSTRLAESNPQASSMALQAAGVQVWIESGEIRWIGFRP